MCTIFRKLLFLFVLFVMPFVSSNAFAACQAITFSYGADGWTTSGEAGSRMYLLTEANKVNVVRYFKSDATNGRYWFLDRNCTLGASQTVLIPLNGSFNAGVPVGFVPLRMGETFVTTEFAADELKEGSNALYTFSYNVEEKYMSRAVVKCIFHDGVAECGLKSDVKAEDFIESVKTYGYTLVGGYLMSLKNSAGDDLNSIRLINGQLVTDYVSTDSTTVKSFRVSNIPLGDTATIYYVDESGNIFADRDRAIRVFSMPVVSDVTQSGVVVKMQSRTTSPTTINTSSLFNDSGVYEGKETVSLAQNVALMLCSYSQEEDLSGNEAVSHCRFNTNMKLSLYSSIGSKAYYPSEVYSPAAADVLAPGSFQLSYFELNKVYDLNKVWAFVDYPCYKASIYGIVQGVSNPVKTSSPVLSLYNKNGVWYSDSSCSVPLGDDNSFDIEVDKKIGVPYLYGTDKSAGLTVHSIGEAYGPITGLPFMCNYRDGKTVMTCTWLVDTLLANTSYYPTDYALLDSSIREIISTHRPDGSVLVVLSSTPCYTLSVNLSSGNVINMYYISGENVWHSGSCIGDVIGDGGIKVDVSDTGYIPVSFSTTSSAAVQRATIDGSYDNKTNVYVLYDAHKDSSNFTLKPTGTITADTTLHPTYTVLSSSAESLVMTYSDQTQYLKNYYQIKIMENDSMPETVFYHDKSGYYNSRYTQLSKTGFSVSLNNSAKKVPVIFLDTEVESPVIKSESNWGGLSSFLYCDYDSVKSQRTMNCRLPSLDYTANHTYYVYSYAELDNNRNLKIVGGQNPLTAYCNPLRLASVYTEQKTYYSQYYQDASTAEYRIRWYSDDACTTELTQNLVNEVNYPFRLPLVQRNGVYAVPFLFDTTGVAKAPVEAGSSVSNPGPIYCVYNSAENSADCMFNWVNGFAVAGVLGAPVSSLTYSGGNFAKILEGKVLTIENNIVEAKTEIVYEDKPFCNVVSLTTPNAELKYDYHTDGINWYSLADTNCEQPVELVLPMLDGAMPIYFNSGGCLQKQNTMIYEETPERAFYYGDGVPCLYSSKDDVLNCKFELKTMTNDTNIFCVSHFVRKCSSSRTASCELNVTQVEGFNSLKVDYTNCCLAGYHDENGVSSTLPIGQTSCK